MHAVETHRAASARTGVPFDVRATTLLNRLSADLLDANPDWNAAARREDLDRFMARLVFCLFAEDIHVFPGEGLFTATLEGTTAADASNTRDVLSDVFRAIDTPPDRRAEAGLPDHARPFPWVGGGLFGECPDGGPVPRFSPAARARLLQAGTLDWKRINPDIFGAMSQAVAGAEERGELGMHYTSVPNVLKALDPLLLDHLRTALDDAGDGVSRRSASALADLRERLTHIRVLDPACGSGNFLVIAYKQMRGIEAEIDRRLAEAGRPSGIPLGNFRGIELRPFAAEVARLALVVALHQCDAVHGKGTRGPADVLPPATAPWIVCGNALRLDWSSVCPPGDADGETFVCGNPPYRGQSERSDDQKAELAALFAPFGVAWKSLDYVAGWFSTFGTYAAGSPTTAAFVTTNSICQGEQVPILWPHLFDRGVSIGFARKSFRWRNLATRNAGVKVTVIGLRTDGARGAILYSDDGGRTPTKRVVSRIGPYLVPDTMAFVRPRDRPINGLPPMDYGSKPADGGGLVVTSSEYLGLRDDVARRFLRPYVGGVDFIDGTSRHCIWVGRAEAEIAAALESPFLRRRSRRVRAFRARSTRAKTRACASRPLSFAEVRHGKAEAGPTLIVPIHTSEERPALPVGVLPRGSIVSNATFGIDDAALWTMAIVASRMHLVWIATVCGKLGTSYRYSNTLGWNTFPLPPLTDAAKADLTRGAEEILLAREAHWPATIAELYDPGAMPDDLRAAHDRNDDTLERIYVGRRFANDTERLETLFAMYARMTDGEIEHG